MSRGRTTAIAVVMVAIIALCGACSSGSSKSSTAAVDKRAAAANKAAAARSKAAIARRRAATIRLRNRAAARTARTAKQRKAKRKAKASTTPTTSYVATIVPVGQPAVPAVAAVQVQSVTAPTTAAGDLGAIERTVNALNAAFRAGVAAGIDNSKAANYWVPGAYSASQCGAFETARGGGVVSETLVLHPDSLTPAPGWVDPVIGRVPQGRIYGVVIDEIQTLVTTGQHRERTFGIHVTVRPGKHARLFLRCA